MCCKVSGDMEGTVDGGFTILIAFTASDFVKDFLGLLIVHA